MQIIGTISDVIGIGGAFFSLFAWLKTKQIQKGLEKERKRQDKKIEIVLQCEGKQSIYIPLPIRRSELTRAEVLGRLGMIPLSDKTQERFKLQYINDPLFLKDIEDILDGFKEGTLKIPCSQAERDQFDFKRMRSI